MPVQVRRRTRASRARAAARRPRRPLLARPHDRVPDRPRRDLPPGQVLRQAATSRSGRAGRAPRRNRRDRSRTKASSRSRAASSPTQACSATTAAPRSIAAPSFQSPSASDAGQAGGGRISAGGAQRRRDRARPDRVPERREHPERLARLGRDRRRLVEQVPGVALGPDARLRQRRLDPRVALDRVRRVEPRPPHPRRSRSPVPARPASPPPARGAARDRCPRPGAPRERRRCRGPAATSPPRRGPRSRDRARTPGRPSPPPRPHSTPRCRRGEGRGGPRRASSAPSAQSTASRASIACPTSAADV